MLHFISLFFLLIFIILTANWKNIINGTLLFNVFILWLISFTGSIFILAQLDVYSRYQNYKQVKDQIYEFGLQERIIRPMLKSKCQRDALLLAGKELGEISHIRNVYREYGFKWYHILPEFIKVNPAFLLNPLFWKTTFFVGYYESKYFN
jgi:hypothetical protein